MKIVRPLFYYLASIRFTILLIASAALFVIIGTLVEAHTSSHRYAAALTYNSPLFTSLLGGLFINILFSTLKRWPFKMHHLPFLLTHMGLLMILSGTMIKNLFGLQGQMMITEGGVSNRVYLPFSEVIALEKKNMDNLSNPETRIIHVEDLINKRALFDKLSLMVQSYAPHCSERRQTWIKKHHAYIHGIRPIAVIDEPNFEMQDPLFKSEQGILFSHDPKAWHFMAFRCRDVEDFFKKWYTNDLKIRITDRKTNSSLYCGPLRQIRWDGAEATAHLDAPFSPIGGLQDPVLTVNITFDSNFHETVRVPLSGKSALLNQLQLPSLQEHGTVAIDLIATPKIALVEDWQGDVYLFSCSPFAAVECFPFRHAELETIVVYDEGFGGYTVQATIPLPESREEKENRQWDALRQGLREGLDTKTVLSPPLALLQQSCLDANVDFVDTTIAFLKLWDTSFFWLYPTSEPVAPPLKDIFESLDWTEVSLQDQKVCQWMSLFLNPIVQQALAGEDLLALLQERGWPLIRALESLREQGSEQENLAPMLSLLLQQFLAASELLPKAFLFPTTAEEKAHLFSAYLWLYGIHTSTTLPSIAGAPAMGATLEAPITFAYRDEPPLRQLESNIPRITLLARERSEEEVITLSYDPSAQGLKRPLLKGRYRLRFQPDYRSLPYSVRLRRARQLNYVSTNQPYSYECDITIEDQLGHRIDKTLTMNHVYQTWDGYRFYLSAIAPSDPGSVKRVQIVVNHDPAKYLLTYPGAVILSVGIVLLFIKWRKKL